jgi:nucleotide-binding universal stress UspA family protein
MGTFPRVTTLVCAVDGSPLALHAIRRALDLVGPPATIVLLHSEPLPAAMAGAGGIEGPVYTPGEIETLRDEEQHDSHSIVDEAAGVIPAGYDVRRRIEQGDPGATICDVAAELHADMVVLGNHGRNALARLVLGSTSTYVVHHCTAPVLVVREEDQGADAAAATAQGATSNAATGATGATDR